MKRLPRLIILLLIALSAPASADDLLTHELAPNVLLIRSGAWENNIVALRGVDALVVIDSFASPRMAREALAAIRAHWNEPVSTVILTHHHWDHSFGAGAFAGAEVITQADVPGAWREEYPDLARRRNASGRHIPTFERDLAAAKSDSPRAANLRGNIEWLKRVNADIGDDFDLVAPMTLIRERQTIRAAGFTIDLFHIEQMHTPGDLIVFVREAGLVCVGDLFYAASLPVLHRKADIDRWIPHFTALELQGKQLRFVVSGHGELIEPDHFILYMRYLSELWRACGPDAQSAGPAHVMNLAPYSILGDVAATHADNVAFLTEHLKRNRP
jgi:glyoxylase-like metal-dependent hydrolase (beta-lactamase superfamily II)